MVEQSHFAIAKLDLLLLYRTERIYGETQYINVLGHPHSCGPSE